jgi:deoxycytidine triphosphate deaminase
VILSDRDIRKQIESGRLVIEPFDPNMIQPSSVDLRVDKTFRIFANTRYPYIDVMQPMDDLTEVVEVKDGEPFILHPGEFVLGSTLESVTLPDDLVARIEGKSSLGRLGLLIHSSLPGSEPVLVLEGGHPVQRTIKEIVDKRIEGLVVGFDQETFEVGYHEITGWYQGPPDRIFRVELRSGRSIRVTGGHSLFTLGRGGMIVRVRVAELAPGARVAIPRRIPDPSEPLTNLDLLELAPESAWDGLVVQGPAVQAAFDANPGDVGALLRELGRRHVSFYRTRARLPLRAALQIPGFRDTLSSEDGLSVRGSWRCLPVILGVDAEFAWLIGLYVAEGYRRRHHVVISNTDQRILDRVERAFAGLGLPVYRAEGAITCSSTLLSGLFEWIGTGGKARAKRIPSAVFGWPRPLIEAFVEGLIDGDGSREATRMSLWSSSTGLVADMLLLAPRLGIRASASYQERKGRPLYQVSMPWREHKLLMHAPIPDQLLIQLRNEAGLDQKSIGLALGYRSGSRLNNLERRFQPAVGLQTLRLLRSFYESLEVPPSSLPRLTRLVEGGIAWDQVREVRDTGSVEAVYDLEVRPGGRSIENFLAGQGGVFASNTAGFVDAGWSGHLTLELSNVANLPITIYPGMKIGQLCLFEMTSPAERPYGERGKYQGQRGPTPSRFYEDFRRETGTGRGGGPPGDEESLSEDETPR